MQPNVVRQPGIPRYLAIATELRRQIAGGTWASGERLPTIRELAARFGVTHVTAREAVKYLEGRGILACRRGSGTYVAGPLLQLQSLSLTPDLRDMASQIGIGSVEPLLPPDEVPGPHIPDGLIAAQSYKRLYRLTRVDGQPMMVTDVYLDAALYKKAAKVFDSNPALRVLMEMKDGALTRARHVMTVDLADEALAGHLNLMPYAPVAQLHLSIRDDRGLLVYSATLMFPAELVRVEFTT